ncbi:hypothetical protein [Natronobeatus ordinarius]|uniref:hypothetical protein n=1 Tax=Natronobeatus ordinarius TaxID=2963433 RepID=UPI0020CCB1F5|nr:hypothetical protein [Natronobeatus ordinarius]
MVKYTSQPVSLPAGRWTPHRVRLAGSAGILGAPLLFAYITISTIVQAQGAVPVWHEIGSLPYYMGEGSLFLAWTGMFAGFVALRARMLGADDRLWRIGVDLAVIGSAMAAVGFLVVTAAPAVGAVEVVDPGNAVIGLGLMIFINVGALLMGVSLLRTGMLPKLVAGLLILVLPATLLAGPVGEALGLGPIVGAIMIAPFVAAVALLGEYLRSETPDDAVRLEEVPDA